MPVPLVEVGKGTLDALASRPDVLATLPFLFQGLLVAKKAASNACGRCGKKAAADAALNEQYKRVAMAIHALSPEHLATLKGFLDAEKLQVDSRTL